MTTQTYTGKTPKISSKTTNTPPNKTPTTKNNTMKDIIIIVIIIIGKTGTIQIILKKNSTTIKTEK